MGPVAARAFTRQSLSRAWEVVLRRDLADGVLADGVARFGEDVQANLFQLAAEIQGGTYVPQDLFEVRIPKDESETRVIHVPAVRDRVVARAILDAVTPIVDPHLGSVSFGYRPGLGVSDAIRALVDLREEGLGWVLRTDVHDCFPSLPVARARLLLARLVRDDELLAVVDLLIHRQARRPGGRRTGVEGAAQGCALSPLLANLVLVALDEALVHRGHPVVRYADDVVVVGGSQSQVAQALDVAREVLLGMGMTLGDDKTQITSFDEGFTFLGEDFGPRYPPAEAGDDAEPGNKRVLYVGLQGSRVRIASGRVVVESTDDARVIDVPCSRLARLVAFGSVGVTAGLRSWALNEGVDVVFASRRGSYLGQLMGPRSGPRTARLKAQLDLQESPRGLELARAMCSAKMLKQVVVLQHFARPESAELVSDAVGSMRRVVQLLPDCATRDELMGMEGAAASAYWACFGALLPESLQFQKRSRQPPRDVANSALSFLYTVLTGECVTALHAAGLDPAFGFLHADDGRRPSLALDLLEEFRPMVVDQAVMQMARRRALTFDYGRSEPKQAGVLLTAKGKDVVMNGYERRMAQPIRGAITDFAGTLRRHVYRQAQRLAAVVADQGRNWEGVAWR